MHKLKHVRDTLKGCL